MLPLTLFGVGYLLCQLFAGAALALPMALGVAAGVAAHQLGCGAVVSFFIGMGIFMAVIAVSRFAALTLVHPFGRIALALLFAIPAALTGYALAHALGKLIGSTGIVAGLVAAAACAMVAAGRFVRPAI